MSKKKSLISPLEAELSALRDKVARRREYMDLLEVELTNTRSALRNSPTSTTSASDPWKAASSNCSKCWKT
jgi:hypothetical protein